MSRGRFSGEQIIATLPEHEVGARQGSWNRYADDKVVHWKGLCSFFQHSLPIPTGSFLENQRKCAAPLGSNELPNAMACFGDSSADLAQLNSSCNLLTGCRCGRIEFGEPAGALFGSGLVNYAFVLTRTP